jgi:hypothetical protein
MHGHIVDFNQNSSVREREWSSSILNDQSFQHESCKPHSPKSFVGSILPLNNRRPLNSRLYTQDFTHTFLHRRTRQYTGAERIKHEHMQSPNRRLAPDWPCVCLPRH